MKKGFIEINGTIFDLDEYKSELNYLKNYIQLDFEDYLSKLGFEKEGNKIGKYNFEATFNNKKLGFEVKLKFSRRGVFKKW